MIRIAPDLLAKVDDVLVPGYNAKYPGAELTRSDVVRMLLIQAISNLENNKN